jgi:hypothetical protein
LAASDAAIAVEVALLSVGFRMSSTPGRVVPEGWRRKKKNTTKTKVRKFGDAATERRPGNPF